MLYNYDIINKAMWKSSVVSPSFTRIKWFTFIVFVFTAEHPINCTQTHTNIIIYIYYNVHIYICINVMNLRYRMSTNINTYRLQYAGSMQPGKWYMSQAGTHGEVRLRCSCKTGHPTTFHILWLTLDTLPKPKKHRTSGDQTWLGNPPFTLW